MRKISRGEKAKTDPCDIFYTRKSAKICSRETFFADKFAKVIIKIAIIDSREINSINNFARISLRETYCV